MRQAAHGDDTLFPRRRPPGQTRSVWFVRCKTCGREQSWNDTGSAHETKEKRLRNLGWYVGRHRSGDECPDCILARKPIGPVGDAMIRAGLVEEPMKENVVEMKPAATKPVIVDPPREPTRADRRRIHEALEDAYPKPDAGYSPGFTDESVAKGLDVSRKWVEDVRSQFFGPAFVFDIAKARAEHAQMVAEGKRLGEEALAAVDRLETHLKQVGTALDAIGRAMEHGK